ncbi:hypothetical protein L596_021082 [Steinernema carpocapsae]|uniref:Uncharacterized protein n=1 Tax=Steinernema carpocapsae TaxID=34508 RepID=A0A4V6A140_STECR|nr:hypothetical protein L596_021082 [Steinernema carpocapsae]
MLQQESIYSELYKNGAKSPSQKFFSQTDKPISQSMKTTKKPRLDKQLTKSDQRKTRGCVTFTDLIRFEGHPTRGAQKDNFSLG